MFVTQEAIRHKMKGAALTLFIGSSNENCPIFHNVPDISQRDYDSAQGTNPYIK